MLERQIVIPASAEQLWDALTEPALLADWFGAEVQWDLRPGGRARFVGEDGTVRGGVVDDVRPGRHLRFRWWPEDGDDAGASQVSYDLEPEEDGTRLTITERPMPSIASAQAGTRSAGSVSAGSVAAGSVAAGSVAAGTMFAGPALAGLLEWSDWDTTMFRCWARLADSRALTTVSVASAVG
jgi:uncharacterized protein YndB with AHSA1/START domain